VNLRAFLCGLATAAIFFSTAGCVGPREGFIGLRRGRTELMAREEERSPGRPPDGGGLHAFPLVFRERAPEREVLEVLWPLFERGSSTGGGEASPAIVRSRFLRLRPFLFSEEFPDRERSIIFPFWWRIRDRREPAGKSADHLWPLYGVHREEIDLIPVTTRHILFPVAAWRSGPGAWKAKLFPLAWVSSGFLDRGIWLLPAIKAGAGRGGWSGGNRFFYLLDPLFQYERFSISEPGRPEEHGETRTEVKLLGGFLGWEVSDGDFHIRLFWFRL
jgi:hypothetical protein